MATTDHFYNATPAERDQMLDDAEAAARLPEALRFYAQELRDQERARTSVTVASIPATRPVPFSDRRGTRRSWWAEMRSVFARGIAGNTPRHRRAGRANA